MVTDSDEQALLRAFVLEIGRALSLAGAAVSETQDRLARIAAACGAPGARFVVLPTALLAAFPDSGGATIEPVPRGLQTMRLDQISALYELVSLAERGKVGAADGLARVAAIRAMRPRHGRLLVGVAHALMTVGFCLILQPTPLDVLVAAGLGAFVAPLVVLSHERRGLAVFAPVLAAVVVSALSFLAVRFGIADPALRTLIAPLVTFLPGGALTTATVELASGEMVAGASRFVSGLVQLLLLAFGIVAGAELVGLPPREALHDVPVNLLGWWAPWLGVAVFGVAVSVYFSAPVGALPWLLITLAVAWVGQLLGDWLIGSAAGGFVGALAMTPVALAVANLAAGPPSQVTFLPAFWLLVPGAIGLIGVTEVFADPATAVLQDLVQPVSSIVAIALGVLCGTTAYRLVAPDR
jgi:uncharacterized membrane protein YjjP (DUF1212 family)